MRDEHDDRIHQAHRQQFGQDMARLASSIGEAFQRLTARLYDAPWSRPQPTAKAPCGKGFTRL